MVTQGGEQRNVEDFHVRDPVDGKGPEPACTTGGCGAGVLNREQLSFAFCVEPVDERLNHTPAGVVDGDQPARSDRLTVEGARPVVLHPAAGNAVANSVHLMVFDLAIPESETRCRTAWYPTTVSLGRPGTEVSSIIVPGVILTGSGDSSATPGSVAAAVVIAIVVGHAPALIMQAQTVGVRRGQNQVGPP